MPGLHHRRNQRHLPKEEQQPRWNGDDQAGRALGKPQRPPQRLGQEAHLDAKLGHARFQMHVAAGVGEIR